ncbi:MAG: hypothetical protein PCALPYG88_7212 [uncultured Paraburkholderia sp.]|nr:MAG: hypothetical protein PCALPYG08_7213 [uncultured Paraburkholderia sp.]CAH2942498.1 MAG: hypothetical protein PCALPYG88_7212 [uncultured Paraburkholderia sp.]
MKSQLQSQEGAVIFRLANDMIEQFNAVARLSRAIVRASQSLNDVQMPGCEVANKRSVSKA